LWWKSVLEHRVLSLLKGQISPRGPTMVGRGVCSHRVLGHTEGPAKKPEKMPEKMHKLKRGEIRVRGGSKGIQTLDTFFRDSERR
jgi:hypothetical protein